MSLVKLKKWDYIEVQGFHSDLIIATTLTILTKLTTPTKLTIATNDLQLQQELAH